MKLSIDHGNPVLTTEGLFESLLAEFCFGTHTDGPEDAKYYWRLGDSNLIIRKDQGKSVIISYIELFDGKLSYKSGSIMDRKEDLPAIITPTDIADLIKERFKS